MKSRGNAFDSFGSSPILRFKAATTVRMHRSRVDFSITMVFILISSKDVKYVGI